MKRWLFIFSILIGVMWSQEWASAASTGPVAKDTSFRGMYVKQSIPDPITFNPGETKQITITFKNTGTSTWATDGRNYVSVYTIQPSYRKSMFADSSWLSASNPVKIAKSIGPNQQTTVSFALTAPSAAGTYTERFQLAVENKTWIQGTGFFLILKVKPGVPASTPSDSGVQVSSTTSNGGRTSVNHKASALLPSPTDIQSKGGEVRRITVSFKNTGSTKWETYSLVQKEATVLRSFTDESSRLLSFADASWVTSEKVVEGVSVVEPGETLQIEFSLQNPLQRGQYSAGFELVTNGQGLNGGMVRIPVTVSEDTPVDFQPTTPVASSNSRELIAEPFIRVGLYKTDKEVQFQSSFPYTVYAGDEVKGVLASDQKGVLRYTQGTYSFKGGEIDFASSNFIRLVPNDPTNYFTLSNYERMVSGRTKNFNTYRGILEYKYSPKSAMTYVINELPMEAYVAGVAETSDGSPVEYNKAMAIAERSYAYSHVSTRSTQDMFDVYATTASQLYLGYNSELLMPRVVDAAVATRGEMVTYEGKPVVTPYYSRSDGRTRSWKEVWGGDRYPWLQSVETVYDKGKTMWGHGVGISGSDALARAGKDNWTYVQILKYYYTGVAVEKIY